MMNKGGCLIFTWSKLLPRVWELQKHLKGTEQKFVTDVLCADLRKQFDEKWNVFSLKA